MLIGGFQKFSLIDYPGKICAIVFTQGCNFRCPYCYNPELVDPQKFTPSLPEKDVFSFLKKRKGQLDAVEITGGEPTLQKDLLAFLEKIKAMGFLVKLDSNGSSPDIIQEIVQRGAVDYLAMDIKAPLERYQEITRSQVNPNDIQRTIKIIMNSDLDYEFRTTIVKSQLSPKDLLKIAQLIKGAKTYVLQKFVPSKTLDPSFKKETSYSDEELKVIKKRIKPYVGQCLIR